MGKNKKKKTKVKTISLEEFSDSYKPDDAVLPTASMGIVNEPENFDNYSNRRTPISKDSAFFGTVDGDGEEVDWSRGADMSTAASTDQPEDDSSDWRQDSESTGPTSAPQKSSAELESNWRQNSERIEPTSAPQKSSAELESNWRSNSTPNKSRKYVTPDKYNWRENIKPTRCR